jgi:hypothetical protein
MNQITEKFSITRRPFIFLLLLTLAAKSTLLSGQNDTLENKIPEVEKSKYAFGAIPVFAFDADLGLKYGAVLNFFDYGDRLNMPAYDQYLYFRFTNTTKGSLTMQSVLESETIFSKAKVIAEASFLRDKNLDFFGFNGMNSFIMLVSDSRKIRTSSINTIILTKEASCVYAWIYIIISSKEN